ncbi:hypothetical protein FGSG_11059 [Fusarium graminearum PH-1]|uniref:Chromosome 3, complete genome n=1 Tax=Gibberella zeae (strain ATCC MYA-4620 / CBS 123657 / FGSC 9075 / NRRL 31084 / PH-1) TaxID=229533 RepID=I1S2Q9_GIBZE|nr:hypothetical protein FGSG_11059 [Fusarium graminearum PH-1]ESU17678.1 hypothetical protein FGSG_11059 [Fusarium graminearum PH-1]EYB29039.1 hypothetical protein FG05_11059 [Fusarium graminearum]CEF87669.1 unnamed protein product [Fusarium graminearum]|eukprot:XP_011325300.1 hypothetical protein FGSG_11059 [Fusarium graminearum PH-1]
MSTPTTEEPFTIFHKFPPEVQLEILRQCSEGDLVCLSLTCRDMHYLAKPLLSEKPDLSKVDQLGSTPDMPQDCMDSDYQYGTTTRRDMLLATNAEPIRLNTLFVKSQGARNTVHVFHALSSCDCATGWGVESIVVCMEGKRSEKLQITIGLREKACHMDIDGGEDGGRTTLITRHINQMPSRG